MKKYFWFGILGIVIFEILNVYFIMPMPGSQEMKSIDAAYFLYKWRWFFRALFAALIIIGLLRGRWKRKWVPVVPLLLAIAVVYMANFKMAADHMFLKPSSMVLATTSENKVDSNRLVLGVVRNGVARAYPIQFLGYHHQVEDDLGGQKVLVTYCTVCRTGRVFEPVVDGRQEKFRLVGMDHFNAMLEDEKSGSWWRQATGEAIAGPNKGKRLPEIFSRQTSLATWMKLYPGTTIMQADAASVKAYDTTMRYESGLSRNALTGTDTASWKDKSWVVGVLVDGVAKAYDWNRLKAERVINDTIAKKGVVILMGDDNKSFFAFYRDNYAPFEYRNDSLHTLGSVDGTSAPQVFAVDGSSSTGHVLRPLQAYQEFYHSWRTFHPETRK